MINNISEPSFKRNIAPFDDLFVIRRDEVECDVKLIKLGDAQTFGHTEVRFNLRFS